MITFAYGYFGLWQKQSNQKGLAPAIGASPDFSSPAQKSYEYPHYSPINSLKRRKFSQNLEKLLTKILVFRKILVSCSAYNRSSL
ncbi:MAG: hypothetical protein PUD26_05330 [bacterium]|nr:hypothetical protein [bacterium]MDD6026008.1 hypothetical protein [bacterium]